MQEGAVLARLWSPAPAEVCRSERGGAGVGVGGVLPAGEGQRA